MELYKTEITFNFSAEDLNILEEIGYKVLPSAEVPYKLSSELGNDYAIYLVGNNKWKHSATVNNALLTSAEQDLNLHKLMHRAEPMKEDSGFACDYYRVGITHPTTKEQKPYIAECNDIIEALNLTYAEANMFKAIWRTAAARTLGLEKSGNTSLRDAEKIKFFGERHYLRESVNANNTDERIVRKNK